MGAIMDLQDTDILEYLYLFYTLEKIGLYTGGRDLQNEIASLEIVYSRLRQYLND